MFNNAIVAFGGWPGGLALAARQYAGGTDQASAPVLPQADYVSINGGAGHAKLPSGQQGDEITIGVAIAAPADAVAAHERQGAGRCPVGVARGENRYDVPLRRL